jgi:ABC-type transport system involved in multi-copper enzyme maturation permease subunit
MVIGATIAYFVIQAQDASVDFVGDLASFGGDGADGPLAGVEQPEHATSILGPLGFLLPIMAFTLGASFYGADQKAGVIELILTWEPKRALFLTARAIGGTAVTALISIVLSAFFVAVLYGLAALTGTTDGVTGQMWGWIGLAVLRSGLAAGLFFLLGLGLTVLLNNSVASIIAFMIYAFVIENLLQAFVSWIGPWLPMANADSFTSGANVVRFDVFGDDPSRVHHGYLAAGLIVLAYATASLITSYIVFNRRDIT